MPTTPQNDEGEIATPMTDELLKIQDEQENYPRGPWIVLALSLEQKLHQASSQIESLKQEVIEWRDDRQKVNADLSEELHQANETIKLQHGLMVSAEKRGVSKATEEFKEQLDQSTKKSEIVEELVAVLDTKIQGKTLRKYMFEKFPATDGHIPFMVFCGRLEQSLSRAENL